MRAGERYMSKPQLSAPVSEPPLQTDRTGTEMPRDQIFEVLSNERRRYVLHYLKQQDGNRVELRELVDQVAAWENDTSVDHLDSADRKCVYTALRQSHLPKLDDAGIVEYDNLRGEVVLTDAAREVQQYLEYVPRADVSWSQYYMGLSAICAVLAAAVWAGVAPVDGLSGFTLAGLFVGLFVVSSSVHAYHSWKSRSGPEDAPEDID